MLGGGGLGDLFDNFSLDSSSVITVIVVAVAAIFVLPQIIYWLTGVNLSAFNWGRSKFSFLFIVLFFEIISGPRVLVKSQDLDQILISVLIKCHCYCHFCPAEITYLLACCD